MSRPMIHKAYMLNATCRGPMCRNPEETSRHHSPDAASSGTSANRTNSSESKLAAIEPACTAVRAKTSRLTATSTGTTRGRTPVGAPATVVARRTSRPAARTQSTHW